MKTRQFLLVPDALADQEWNANPDMKLGMISYMGVPVAWPNGEIFGTICVLAVCGKTQKLMLCSLPTVRASGDVFDWSRRFLVEQSSVYAAISFGIRIRL
jgi:hypothetical protein